LVLCLFIIFAYFVIKGLNDYFVNQQELEKTQKAADEAAKGYEQSQEEVDWILCEPPGMKVEPLCAKFR
jgi:uncharacterized membrane protein (DUF106 family)